MQRIANPSTPVRFRPEPPKYKAIIAWYQTVLRIAIIYSPTHSLMCNVQAHWFGGGMYWSGLLVG